MDIVIAEGEAYESFFPGELFFGEVIKVDPVRGIAFNLFNNVGYSTHRMKQEQCMYVIGRAVYSLNGAAGFGELSGDMGVDSRFRCWRDEREMVFCLKDEVDPVAGIGMFRHDIDSLWFLKPFKRFQKVRFSILKVSSDLLQDLLLVCNLKSNGYPGGIVASFYSKVLVRLIIALTH